MTDLRKAAEMALEFCEDIGDLAGPYPYVNGTSVVSDSRKVLQALRQALAEAEEKEKEKEKQKLASILNKYIRIDPDTGNVGIGS